MKKYIKPETTIIELDTTQIMVTISNEGTDTYLGKGDNGDSWDDED